MNNTFKNTIPYTNYIAIIYESGDQREDYKIQLASGEIKRKGLDGKDGITNILRTRWKFSKEKIEDLLVIATNMGKVVVDLETGNFIVPR